MHANKRKKLESHDWKIDDTRELLKLNAAEEACIALRLKLAEGLKSRRTHQDL